MSILSIFCNLRSCGYGHAVITDNSDINYKVVLPGLLNVLPGLLKGSRDDILSSGRYDKQTGLSRSTVTVTLHATQFCNAKY